MRKALDKLYLISGALSVFCMICICAVVSVQVGFNIINSIGISLTGESFGLLVPSYTEFAGFFLVGTTFLGLAASLKDDEHIRVLLFLQRLSPRNKAIAEAIACVIAIALCSVLAWNTILLLEESWRFNDVSIGIIPVPLWIPQLPMVIGICILTIAFADRLINSISRIGS